MQQLPVYSRFSRYLPIDLWAVLAIALGILGWLSILIRSAFLWRIATSASSLLFAAIALCFWGGDHSDPTSIATYGCLSLIAGWHFRGLPCSAFFRRPQWIGNGSLN